MLAVPEAQRRGEHIGVDVLTEKLRGRSRRILAAFGAAMVAIVAALLITEGLEMVAFTWMLGLLSNNLPEIELWIIQSLVPLGGVLLLLVALVQLAAYTVGRPPQAVEERRAGPLE
jgi:TRAP-type C4-dicarboxylate transport system permease small subunit